MLASDSSSMWLIQSVRPKAQCTHSLRRSGQLSREKFVAGSRLVMVSISLVPFTGCQVKAILGWLAYCVKMTSYRLVMTHCALASRKFANQLSTREQLFTCLAN